MRPLVVDCSQLCYSSAFTMKDLSHDERKTGVIFGFLLQVFKLAHEFSSREFIFCWDSKKRKRAELYSEYKADRKSAFDEDTVHEVQLQMGYLREKVLPELGFKNSFIRTGLEADDLIACAIEEMEGGVIISNDGDLYQLLDSCEMYRISSSSRYDASDFIKQYGIGPSLWVDVLCIVGTHNNVKGIEGAGVAKAIQYLKGTLSKGKIMDRVDSQEGQEIRKRNRKLIELPFEKIDLDIQFPDRFDIDRWIGVFDRYDFRSFTNEKGMKYLKETFFDRW